MTLATAVPGRVPPQFMPHFDSGPSLRAREDLGLKLRAKRKEAKLTTAQAAEYGDISVTQLGAIERGNHSLLSMSAGNLARLPAAFGLSWNQFVEIVAPVYGDSLPFLPSSDNIPTPRDEVTPIGEVHRVPVIGMAAAGYGVELSEVEPIAYDYVSPEHYRAHMLILQIDGDSMTKSGEVNSLQQGDWVYLDSRAVELQEGKIYVVYVPGRGVLIKRVRHWLGEWILTSDNPDYEPIKPTEDTHIIGRVYYRQPKGEKL